VNTYDGFDATEEGPRMLVVFPSGIIHIVILRATIIVALSPAMVNFSHLRKLVIAEKLVGFDSRAENYGNQPRNFARALVSSRAIYIYNASFAQAKDVRSRLETGAPSNW
jgi:hypothetical protein